MSKHMSYCTEDRLTAVFSRHVTVDLILPTRTVACAVTPPGTGHAAPFLSTPESLWGAGLGVLALLVRPVRTVLPPVTHKEPTDAHTS